MPFPNVDITNITTEPGERPGRTIGEVEFGDGMKFHFVHELPCYVTFKKSVRCYRTGGTRMHRITSPDRAYALALYLAGETL